MQASEPSGWRASGLGDSLDGAARDRLEQALFVARERLDAADLLAGAPHRTESIHVLTRALHVLEEAVLQLKQGLPESMKLEQLLPVALVESLQSSRERLEAAPRLDALLSADDIRFWQATRKLARRLCSRLRVVARRRRAVLARRAAFATCGLVGVAIVLGGWIAHARLRDRFEVSASDFYARKESSSRFRPERAVDGNLETEWLAPEGRNGWLELKFVQPTNVSAVRIVNARNPPHQDRATKVLEIRLYRGEDSVSSATIELDPIEASAVQTIPIQGAGITRIRLNARSHYGRGAGLAEVQVIEEVR